MQECSKSIGIGVHLWLTGSGVDRDPYKAINLGNLIPRNTQNEQQYIHNRGVGELPSSVFGSTVNSFDEEVLKKWKSQLLS